MKNVIEKFTESAYQSNYQQENNKMNNGPRLIIAFVFFIIYVVLILLLGKLLWNNTLVPLVPGVKEATSVFQILGLYILIQLMI